MVDGTTGRALQEALDRQAILDVLTRYCRGVDRRDETLLRSAYHTDSYDDHGAFRGTGPDFIEWLMDPDRPTSKSSQHSISNTLVELDGDTAYVETYLVAYSLFDGDQGEHLEILGARYIDRFERRDGDWRIAHRVVVHDWSRVERYDGPTPAGKAFAQGQRGPDDPSYARSMSS